MPVSRDDDDIFRFEVQRDLRQFQPFAKTLAHQPTSRLFSLIHELIKEEYDREIIKKEYKHIKLKL